MKKVEIKQRFIDRHTGKMRNVGEVVDLTEERIAEIQSVDPMLITVLTESTSKKDSDKSNKKDSDKAKQ